MQQAQAPSQARYCPRLKPLPEKARAPRWPKSGRTCFQYSKMLRSVS